MSKVITIEQLQSISALERKRAKLDQFINNDCNKNTVNAVHNIIATVKAQVPASEKACSLYVELPKIEFDVPLKSFFQMLAIGVAAALLFGLIFIPEGKWLYYGLLAIAAGVLIFNRMKREKNKEQIHSQREQQYQKNIETYAQVIADYKKEIDVMAQQLPRYKAAYQQAFPKCLELCCDGEKQKAAATEDLAACTKELNENGFISVEYIYLVDEIIHMLQTGRADDYKEALNLAIEEDRQRKIEAARRAEEERRQAEMARQAEEARIRAEVDAKLQADRERAAAEKAAKDQAVAAKQAADKAQRERNLAGFRKCINCANNSKCSIYVQENGGGLTCGSYRPR